jgi:hypothetical protein
MLISQLKDIPKNVIDQKINMNPGNFNVKWKKMTKMTIITTFPKNSNEVFLYWKNFTAS